MSTGHCTKIHYNTCIQQKFIAHPELMTESESKFKLLPKQTSNDRWKSIPGTCSHRRKCTVTEHWTKCHRKTNMAEL